MKISLYDVNPEIALEWHPTLNGDLKPTDVYWNSKKKVWWCCNCGHVWKDSILNRSKGICCPFDSGWYPIAGMVIKHSDKEVFWRCKFGHEWQTSISSNSKVFNCPYCSSKRGIFDE